MKIGIVAENRPLEKRVVISPPELKGLTDVHEVIVERNAGIGIDILDYEYEEMGASIGTKTEAYAADLVVRIKEPVEEELKLMKKGSIILSMMHLRCSLELEEWIKKYGLIAIPLENLKDPFGQRKVEAVVDSGRIGMEYGFKLWGKDPARAKVKIMGYGNMSVGAIRCASKKLAKVEVLNRRHFAEMEKHLTGIDILVDAVNRPYRREVKKEQPFVTREMLKLLKKGSVLVDLVSNPENHAPIETMRPTYLNDPYYEVDGIKHTSLWGWPAMEPWKIAKRYSIQIAPIVKFIADKGLDKCPDFIKRAVFTGDNYVV